jgi:hypothetical protein
MERHLEFWWFNIISSFDVDRVRIDTVNRYEGEIVENLSLANWEFS